jgi:hypothetical protein
VCAMHLLLAILGTFSQDSNAQGLLMAKVPFSSSHTILEHPCRIETFRSGLDCRKQTDQGPGRGLATERVALMLGFNVHRHSTPLLIFDFHHTCSMQHAT